MSEQKDKAFVRQSIDTVLSPVRPDPWLAQRIMNQEKEESRAAKRKLSAGLVLAIVLMLGAMTALALSHSYVIRYLFGRNMDSPEAEELERQVQPINFVQHGESVVSTVKDALFDGKSLSIGLSFQTDRPIYLITEHLLINGRDIDSFDHDGYRSTVEDFWVHNGPGAAQGMTEAIHGFRYDFHESLPADQPVEVTLRIILLAPRKAVHPVDVYQEDKPAMWREIDAAYAAGETPIDSDEPYDVLVSSGWFQDFQPSWGMQKPIGDAQALVEYANMEIVDTLEAAFTLKASFLDGLFGEQHASRRQR